jgi:23S rRNA pseudouridine1911/1915/1917 synthase
VERIAFQVSARSTERLDRFLADQLSLSRTQAARLVAGGSVTVNDELARASRTLAWRDTVVIDLASEPASAPRVLKANPRPLNVVFEDSVLLVIDKPAGLVVHPAPGHWEDTLLNALVARGTSLSTAGANGVGRPGIVHRLDKDTSGLMVLAKTDSAHRRLGRQLSQRRVKRVYAALVWGHIDTALDIDAPLARHPNDRKRMAVLASGRSAQTKVEPMARFDVCDLVSVRLETGRTHQIRVHLAHVGHPVVGDPVYGGGGYKRMTGSQHGRSRALEAATPRQALHAARLGFRHPETDERVEFVAEWPADLRESLSLAANEPSLLARDNLLEYLGFSG